MKEQMEALVNQLIERGIKLEEALGELEKKFIKKALDGEKGNQSKVSRILGIHRNTLSRKISLYGLNHKPKRRRPRR